MRIVLFLGAGFSKAFGLPTMAEFFRHARDSTRLTPAEKEFLNTLRRSTSQATHILEGDMANLEHVLSFALMSSVDSQDALASHPTYERLCNILGRIYTQGGADEYRNLTPKLRKLLSLDDRAFLSDPTELTIITTNYDVVADYAFYQLGVPLKLPFEWTRVIDPGAQPRAVSLYPEQGSSALLCKLHGSANWFGGPDESRKIRVEDTIVPGTHHGKDNIVQIELPRVHFGNYTPPEPPLIVPPTFFKHTPDPRLNSTWIEATRALSMAQYVCFIGYSFPASDTHMKYFLAGALKDNVGLESITILDFRAAEIVERLRSENWGSEFKRLLNPITHLWEQERVVLFDNFKCVRR